jgi:ribosomal protein S21
MDNEEIRELLKKLKERSDESTAVKSQVIRIHFDTPKEARKREAAKRKAEKKAARAAKRNK